MTKAAVIDLGSNSIRMGIFHTEGGKLVQSERFRKQVRISEGLDKDNLLKTEPMKRTFEAAEKLINIAHSKGVERIKIVATEALRRAENRDVFLDMVKQGLGFEIQIIDGIKEALYDTEAAKMSADYKDFYMIDTGGGSVEIVLVKDLKVIKSCCLPLGSVVMTEKFKPDENGYNEFERFITYELIKSEVIGVKNIPVVALGGSNKELAKVHKGIDKEIDGYKISYKDARKIYEELKGLSLEERKEVKGLDSKRADTVVSGLCPMMVLGVLADVDEITFCTGSVREGVAAEMLL